MTGSYSSPQEPEIVWIKISDATLMKIQKLFGDDITREVLSKMSLEKMPTEIKELAENDLFPKEEKKLKIFGADKDGIHCDKCGTKVILSSSETSYHCPNYGDLVHRTGIDLKKSQLTIDSLPKDGIQKTTRPSWLYGKGFAEQIISKNLDRAVTFSPDGFTVFSEIKQRFYSEPLKKCGKVITSTYVCEGCFNIYFNQNLGEIYRLISVSNVGYGMSDCRICSAHDYYGDDDSRVRVMKRKMNQNCVFITLQRVDEQLDRKLINLLSFNRTRHNAFFRSPKWSEKVSTISQDIDSKFNNWVSARLARLAKKGLIEQQFDTWDQDPEYNPKAKFTKRLAEYRGKQSPMNTAYLTKDAQFMIKNSSNNDTWIGMDEKLIPIGIRRFGNYKRDEGKSQWGNGTETGSYYGGSIQLNRKTVFALIAKQFGKLSSEISCSKYDHEVTFDNVPTLKKQYLTYLEDKIKTVEMDIEVFDN